MKIFFNKISIILTNISLKVKNFFEIADDDFFLNIKSIIDGKYHWNPKGAFREVKAGDSPADPPRGMILFQKIN